MSPKNLEEKIFYEQCRKIILEGLCPDEHLEENELTGLQQDFLRELRWGFIKMEIDEEGEVELDWES